MQSGSGPRMDFRLNPVRIVECPHGDPAYARKNFPCPCHGRAACWTKFHFCPAVAFVGAVFISFEKPLVIRTAASSKYADNPKALPVRRLQKVQ